jgi:hypothetical protein
MIQKFNGFTKLNEEKYRSIKTVIRGDKEVAEKAVKLVGDGNEPNLFFVTVNNDYVFLDEDRNTTDHYFNDPDNAKKAPIKIEDHIEMEVFGPFETLKEAMDKSKEIDLNEEIGPRSVIVEDRKSGTIYERYLEAKRKIVWQEEIQDDIKRFGYDKK